MENISLSPLCSYNLNHQKEGLLNFVSQLDEDKRYDIFSVLCHGSLENYIGDGFAAKCEEYLIIHIFDDSGSFCFSSSESRLEENAKSYIDCMDKIMEIDNETTFNSILKLYESQLTIGEPRDSNILNYVLSDCTDLA